MSSGEGKTEALVTVWTKKSARFAPRNEFGLGFSVAGAGGWKRKNLVYFPGKKKKGENGLALQGERAAVRGVCGMGGSQRLHLEVPNVSVRD